MAIEIFPRKLNETMKLRFFCNLTANGIIIKVGSWKMNCMNINYLLCAATLRDRYFPMNGVCLCDIVSRLTRRLLPEQTFMLFVYLVDFLLKFLAPRL